SQTDPADPAHAAEYGRFRRLMTGEANAAIEGALAAGATKVVVNDSHWFMRNLLAEELHQAAELLSGDPTPRSTVQGIDSRAAAPLTQTHAPLVLPPPITVEVDFALTIHADMAELCPGATRTAGRTVAFTHQDYREVFRGWRAMLNLSAVVE